MRTANTAQKFTNEVWIAIQLRDDEKANEDVNHDTHMLRVKNTIQFLQVASQQRLEEIQAAWNQNCEDWAVQQHTAMAQLTAQQQVLKTQISALVTAAAKMKKKRTPTYLQSVVPVSGTTAAVAISILLGAAPRLPTMTPGLCGNSSM